MKFPISVFLRNEAAQSGRYFKAEPKNQAELEAFIESKRVEFSRYQPFVALIAREVSGAETELLRGPERFKCEECGRRVSSVVELIDPCFAGDDNGGKADYCGTCALAPDLHLGSES